MARGDRGRQPSVPVEWHVGDHFIITGPRSCWRSPHRSGWQPQFWSGSPKDVGSRRVRRDTVEVDCEGTFEILELREELVRYCGTYISARIEVSGVKLWFNVAQNGVPWARKVN